MSRRPFILLWTKVVQNSSLKKHALGSAALYTKPPGFLSGRFWNRSGGWTWTIFNAHTTMAPDDLLSRTFMRSHVPVTRPGGFNSPKLGTLERICCGGGGQDMKPCHHSFLLPQGNYSLTSQKGDFGGRGHLCRLPASWAPLMESSSAYPVPDLNRWSPPWEGGILTRLDQQGVMDV